MRLATFNCENLFARFKFKKNVDPTALDGFSINDTAFDLLDEAEKKITAEVISEVNAMLLHSWKLKILPYLNVSPLNT